MQPRNNQKMSLADVHFPEDQRDLTNFCTFSTNLISNTLSLKVRGLVSFLRLQKQVRSITGKICIYPYILNIKRTYKKEKKNELGLAGTQLLVKKKKTV